MTSSEVDRSPGAKGTGFFRELQGLDVSSIQAYLDKCTQPFDESEIYIVAEEKNVIDPSQRRSHFRRITDVALFTLIEPIVAQLNQEDPMLEYMLVCNDVTHIKYTEGGFFGKHNDYLSVTSNMIEEFAMLLCVTPSKQAAATRGGKTVLHLHKGTHASDATTIPGCALVFRKDVEHESTVLEAGEKHIITLNLWAWRKAEHHPDNDVAQVLLVTFPSTGRHAGSTDELDLTKVAGERSYAIPVQEAKLSPKLADYLETTTAKSQGPILRYTCCDCEYDAFGTVFRVLRRMHVSSRELLENQQLLATYGLESTSALVMPISTEDKENDEPDAADKVPLAQYSITIYFLDGSSHILSVSPIDTVLSLRQRLEAVSGKEGLHLVLMEGGAEMLAESKTLADFDSPQQLTAVKRRLKADEYVALGLTQAEMEDLMKPEPPAVLQHKGSDVIVCDSLARSRVLASIAKDVGLPYVGFQAIFVEGSTSISGDTCRPGEYPMAMAPVFMCVSDRRHLLSWWSCNWWEDEEPLVRQHNSLFDLSRVLKDDIDVAALTPMVINRTNCDHEHEDWGLPLPGVMDATQPSRCWQDDAEGLASGGQELFHIDSDGQTCFTKVEAAAAVEHLDSMGFADQIMSRLNCVPFQLPQHSETRGVTFCNERVYGNLNVLLVSGVVRLLKD